MKARLDFICEALAGVGVVLQTDEILRFFSLILTCISVGVSLSFTIYKWYKDAKSDGKVDGKEVAEFLKAVEDHTEKLNNIVEKSRKDGIDNG